MKATVQRVKTLGYHYRLYTQPDGESWPGEPHLLEPAHTKSVDKRPPRQKKKVKVVLTALDLFYRPGTEFATLDNALEAYYDLLDKQGVDRYLENLRAVNAPPIMVGEVGVRFWSVPGLTGDEMLEDLSMLSLVLKDYLLEVGDTIGQAPVPKE